MAARSKCRPHAFTTMGSSDHATPNISSRWRCHCLPPHQCCQHCNLRRYVLVVFGMDRAIGRYGPQRKSALRNMQWLWLHKVFGYPGTDQCRWLCPTGCLSQIRSAATSGGVKRRNFPHLCKLAVSALPDGRWPREVNRAARTPQTLQHGRGPI
jgi:hypothetical protein